MALTTFRGKAKAPPTWLNVQVLAVMVIFMAEIMHYVVGRFESLLASCLSPNSAISSA